jgi:hypothetical protein
MTTPPGFHALPLPLAQLSLAAVLKCGQSFRWSIYPLHAALPSDPTHEYRLCLQDRVVCLRQSSGALFYCAVFPDVSVSLETVSTRDAETLEWLRDYFQLDVDLVKLYGEWAERDPVFAKLRTRFEGIRMLRQDPWENLVSCAPTIALLPVAHPIQIHMLFEQQHRPYHKNGKITLHTVFPPFLVNSTPQAQVDNCDWTAYAI